MGLFSNKTKPEPKPSQPVRRSEPAPTGANNWNRKYNLGDVVRLTDGSTMEIGGLDEDWYNGWTERGFTSATNEHIRGRA